MTWFSYARVKTAKFTLKITKNSCMNWIVYTSF